MRIGWGSECHNILKVFIQGRHRKYEKLADQEQLSPLLRHTFLCTLTLILLAWRDRQKGLIHINDSYFRTISCKRLWQKEITFKNKKHVIPQGLQPLIGTTETALEMEEVGGGSEMEQGTLENGSQTCSSDIINVPPLVPSNADGVSLPFTKK